MARNWFSGSLRRNSSNRFAQSKLSMETLEPRLVLSWSGAPPASMALPNANKVNLNSQGDAVGVNVINSTEVDYYKFKAKFDGSYVISTSVPFDNLDTVIGLYDANGTLLQWNNNISGSNTDSSLTWTCTKNAWYYVGITNVDASTKGGYIWSIDGSNFVDQNNTPILDDQYENNDSQFAAYHFGTLTATQTWNSLVMTDSEDWYSFTTIAKGTAADTVTIDFQHSQGNLQLHLYNAAGKKVRTSQGKTDFETVSLEGLNAGMYYVRVFSGRGVNNPDYSLTIDAPSSGPTASGFEITITSTGLSVSQRAIFQQAAERWQQIIVGDLPDARWGGRNVDDVWIEAKAVKIDGPGGILGEAGPDVVRTNSYLPVHGVMKFDSADLNVMEQNGTLFSVVVHEMGHVLGLGTLWAHFGLISGAGTANPVYTGANALAHYNSIFGTNDAGVPLENTGGVGTADAHWRESVFGHEIMTGWVDSSGNLPISKVTVGALKDLGYQVAFSAADPYVPGGNLMAAAKALNLAPSLSAALIDTALSPGQKGRTKATTGKTTDLRTTSLQPKLVDAALDAIPRRLKANEPAAAVAEREIKSNSDIDQMWDEFQPAVPKFAA